MLRPGQHRQPTRRLVGAAMTNNAQEIPGGMTLMYCHGVDVKLRALTPRWGRCPGSQRAPPGRRWGGGTPAVIAPHRWPGRRHSRLCRHGAHQARLPGCAATPRPRSLETANTMSYVLSFTQVHTESRMRSCYASGRVRIFLVLARSCHFSAATFLRNTQLLA